MAKNFKELEAKMSPERIAASDAIVKKILAEIELSESQKKRKLVRKNS